MRRTSFTDHPLGHLYESDRIIAFFGDRRSLPDAVSAAFSKFRVLTLKQTHSDIVVESPVEIASSEADAHFTRSTETALCIRTADCLPIMIHDPATRLVAAIHAGWRGVENEIILKACARLKAEGATLHDAEAWIGPHIGVASFEVGRDVAERLENVFLRSARLVLDKTASRTSLVSHPEPTKARVDLLKIAQTQLLSMGIDGSRTHLLPIDTFASPTHESHRRDRDRAGRQISFIALK